MFDAASPSPRAVIGGILGAAAALSALALLVILFSTGHIEWKLVGLIGVLWGAWGLFSGLLGSALEPAGKFLVNQLTGNTALPDASETLDRQTARLERLIAQPLEPHHEILVGIRLAEIYRLNQRDPAKADALLARLRARYPDAPELAGSPPR